MLKFTAFFRKRQDLSQAAFQRHWLEDHAQLVLRLPGLVRYVQNHPLPGLAGDGAAFHGIVEVWLENAAALDRDPEDPYWREVAEDEARFIDPASLSVVPVEETVVKDSDWPRRGVKIIRTLKALADKPPPVAVLPAVRRYARNRVAGEAPAIQGYDAAWFDTLREAHTATGSLRDPAVLNILLAIEHVMKA
jgi:uncharacterized protein (TIGR02118 family)